MIVATSNLLAQLALQLAREYVLKLWVSFLAH